MSLLLAPLALAGCATVESRAAISPDGAIARHLAAIQARDLAGIEATITRGPDLLLIFPNGSMTATRAEYLQFHREWFADRGWTMNVTPVHVQRSGDYVHVLLRSAFDPDGAGPKTGGSNLLALGFRLEEGEWRLVHDQNTRIAK